MNETGDITEEPENMHRVFGEYYEQLHKHKFNNLTELDQLIKTQKLDLAGVTQWIECQTVNQRAAVQFPVKAHTCLACGPGPQ